ncbi:MAG: response regulator transcription factor [Defluviitaleaceae bacterium]|nr:response regulator transcription factor [Defluviitaleaceae bacterium]MCL2275435.1 response regulator transcription factor [Defluviitaleaceae bacterium]
MYKILIVEDDIHISEMLCELLGQHAYAVVPAFSGTEALLRLQEGGFSLVLLDVMLPGKDGGQVLAEMRASMSLPIIMLTAKTDKETTVKLLQMGADDYIAKPFDNNELLARIAVQLRRTEGTSPPANTLQYKDIILDDDGYDAVIAGERVGLSKREFEILRILMAFPEKVFSKNNLYESVWGGEFFGDDNTVNVHMSKLRSKLNAINPHEEYIQTVWGIGYKMGK